MNVCIHLVQNEGAAMVVATNHFRTVTQLRLMTVALRR